MLGIKASGVLSLLGAALLLVLPSVASAQYMYLDTNSDTVNDAGDVIQPTGTTTVEFYLVTNKNRAGEAAACSIDDTLPMTLYSYFIVLDVVGGTVNWGPFQNTIPSFTTAFQTGSNPTQFAVGFGSSTPLQPGRYRLGRLTLTVTSGTPSLRIGTTTSFAQDVTSFGSSCYGMDFDNTLKLGSDWTDADGVRAAGNGPPILSPLFEMLVPEGATGIQAVSATDPEGAAVMLGKAFGPGYMTVSDVTASGSTTTGIIRVSPGFEDAGIDSGGVYASDGSATATASFKIRVIESTSIPELAPPYNMSVGAGQSATQVLAAYDVDGDAAQVSFRLVSGPTFVSVVTLSPTSDHEARGEIRLAPGAGNVGKVTIRVAAVKGGESAEADLDITVLSTAPVNAPPIITELPDVYIAPGGRRKLFLEALDPDENTISARKLSGPPYVQVGVLTFPGYLSQVIQIGPAPSELEEAAVVIGVNDGLVETFESFTVHVVNPTPVFTQIHGVLASLDAPYTQVIRGDGPTDAQLHFTKVSGPSYLTVEQQTFYPHDYSAVLKVSAHSGDAGTAHAVIGLTDGVNTTTQDIEITVVPPCPVALAGRIPAPGQLSASLLGDVDGDGTVDLVGFVENSFAGGIWPGLSDGTFGPMRPISGSVVVRAALSDLNGDGRQDLFLKSQGGWVAARLATADGSFGAEIRVDQYLGGDYVDSFVLADVNEDGRTDVVARMPNPPRLQILLGHGDGTFSVGPVTQLSGDPYSTAMALADFNADSHLDMAVGTAQVVSVFLGDGSGAFSLSHAYLLGRDISSLAAGDMNGDGRPDLVASRFDIAILLNDGSGGFHAPRVTPSPVSTGNIRLGDVTGDGRLDVVADGSQILIFPGTASDSLGLASGSQFAVVGWDLALSDLNKDGRLDWIARESYPNASSTIEYLNLGCGASGAPVVLAPHEWSGIETQLVRLEVSAADPDATPIDTWEATPLPPGATFEPSPDHRSAVLSWTPSTSQAGDYAIQFAARNSQTGVATTHLHIADSDRPPTVEAPSARVACVGSTITFQVRASDPDAQPILDLTATPLPPGATFSVSPDRSGGAFVWNTDASSVGTYPISFRASNALAGSSVCTIVVQSSCAIPFAYESPDTTGWVGSQTSLVVDRFGITHVAYAAAGHLRYGIGVGGQWGIEDVARSLPAQSPSLALVGGQPWIAFAPVINSQPVGIRVAYQSSPGSWFTETIPMIGAGSPSLAFDPQGVPHVAFSDGFGAVRYATRTGSDWTVETVHSSYTAYSVQLAFDGAGVPHVIAATGEGLLHAVRGANGWVRDFHNAGGANLALAFDGIRVHIAAAGGTRLEHHVLDGGVWQVENVATLSGSLYSPGSSVSMQIDQLGRPIIAYHDAASGTLNLAWKQGGSWKSQVVDAGKSGFSVSLGLAGNAEPRLSYFDEAHGDLRYAFGPAPPSNQSPIARAGGPYEGTVGERIMFDGSGSSDPDGDALTFTWSFGDGLQGSGVHPEHAYAAAGAYTVSLTVDDGDLHATAGTTAIVTALLEARAFMTGAARSVPLTSSAFPYLTVLLEPVNGGYRNEDLDPASLVMRSDSTGSVDEVHSDVGKSNRAGDRDHNGVQEIALRFSRADLALLFASTQGRSEVNVTIEGALMSGARVMAPLTLRVVDTGSAAAARVFPNPLNPSGILAVVTRRAGSLDASLFDVSGRLVRVLAREGFAPAGYRELPIDGSNAQGHPLASGVYFYRVKSADGTLTGRFTIAR